MDRKKDLLFGALGSFLITLLSTPLLGCTSISPELIDLLKFLFFIVGSISTTYFSILLIVDAYNSTKAH